MEYVMIMSVGPENFKSYLETRVTISKIESTLCKVSNHYLSYVLLIQRRHQDFGAATV